jgi:hypothetical protein
MRAWFLCKYRADLPPSVGTALMIQTGSKAAISRDNSGGLVQGGLRMRLIIEIAAAALLVCCISASSAAFAAKPGRSADGLSCAFSVPANASPAARCAAIKRQCGGKFSANYCGDRLLSAT